MSDSSSVHIQRPREPARFFWLLVVILALLAYLTALAFEFREGPLVPGTRIISDRYDRAIYYKRAQFYPLELTPYVDVFSEYPSLSTLSFAIPLLLEPDSSLKTYAIRWSAFMAFFFLAVVVVIFRSRSALGLARWPVVIMASPTLLYFSLMRFDIMATFLCCLSLFMFQRRNYVLAHILLAVGVHVKWYPAVIFPVYFAYHMYEDGLFGGSLRTLVASRSVRYACAFLLPTLLIAALTILAYGWDGFMVPYQFHGNRGGQYFNPYWFAREALAYMGWATAETVASMNYVFLAAQFSVVGVLFFKRLRSHHQVVQYAVLSIAVFVSFARVDSPQWILWYVPLALMFVSHRDTLIALIVLTILNYVVFPVAFDTIFRHGRGSDDWQATAFHGIVFVKDLALWAFLWFALKREADPDASRPASGEHERIRTGDVAPA